MTNEKTDSVKNKIISTILSNVKNGMMSIPMIFSNFDPVTLTEAFINDPDPVFFQIALKMSIESVESKATSIHFLEYILIRSPETIYSLKPTVDVCGGENSLISFIQTLLIVYFDHPHENIRKIIDIYQIEQIIPQIFIISNIKPDRPYRIIESFLLSYYKSPKFGQLLNDMIKIALNDNNEKIVNEILDFVQKGSIDKCFQYSDMFAEIFSNIDDMRLIAILVDRISSTPEHMVQVQMMTLGPKASILKESMKKQHISTNTKISEAELIEMAESFCNTHVIPAALAHLNMFDRPYMISTIAPTLKLLSRSNQPVFFLLSEMENKKMIPKAVQSTETVNWKKIIDNLKDSDLCLAQMAESVEKSNVTCDQYAPALLKSFNSAIYTRHHNDVPSFTQSFTDKFLKQLPAESLQQLAKFVFSYLKSELLKQHRISLSILALRLPIMSYIDTIFNHKNEISIMIYLHKAAIFSATRLSINGAYDSIQFSQQLVLRLRWRTFRGDITAKSKKDICWLPEFLQLCENDPVLFLKWELREITAPEDRMQVLSKLGITTSLSLFPRFAYEVLSSMNPNIEVVSILQMFFSQIPYDQVRLPENPNIEVLFAFDFLWCPSVLNHPFVVKALRHPSLMMAKSLIHCANENQDFSAFPLAFAAILMHIDNLKDDLPRVLVDANMYLSGHLRSEDAPLYIILAVVYVNLQKKNNILEFAEKMRGAKWLQVSLFFAICSSDFDSASKLLDNHTSLVSVLSKGIKEGRQFYGTKVWKKNLIEFTMICAMNNKKYDQNPEWNSFLIQVQKSGQLPQDAENLNIFQRYYKFCEIA